MNQASTESDKASSRWKTIGWAIIFVLAGVVASIVGWRLLDVETDLHAISVGGWIGLGLAVVIELVGLASLGGLFRSGIHRRHKTLSYQAAGRSGLVAASVSRLVPAGGALSAPAMAIAVKSEVGDATSDAIRATILSYGGLLVWGGLGLIGSGVTDSVVAVGAGSAVTGTIATMVGVAILFGSAWLGSAIKRLPGFLRKRMGSPPSAGTPSLSEFAWLGFRFTLESGALWLSLSAFGVDLSISQTMLAFALPQIIGGVTGLPGGIGVTEASMFGLLTAFGVPAAASLAPVLVYRLISQWIPAGVGLIAGGATVVSEVFKRPKKAALA